MEELRAKHRQEQRELQGRITQKKKNATKKTRKAINDECATLEQQLVDRQQQEINAIDPVADDAPVGKSDGSDDERSVDSPSDHTSSNPKEPAPSAVNDATIRSKKPNRQKARLARRAAAHEAAAAEAAEEAAAMPDPRAQEQAAIEREAAARGLVEREVRSDGHCMYAAVADQLAQAGRPPAGAGGLDYQAVRSTAADYINQHSAEFAPFLEEPLDQYVDKIRNTAAWGGHLELTALAQAYGLCIQVLHGDGRVDTMAVTPPRAEAATDIWLAYRRHAFGLGEHYNSLRKTT